MTTPYIPTRDPSGQLIADLSTAELKRRLARVGGDTHPISVQYRRAYTQALAVREGK